MILDPVLTTIFYIDILFITISATLLIAFSGKRSEKREREVFLVEEKSRKLA
ncbi:MAG: hypothetical protein V2A69_05735 [Pseudomonadota bacterium]